MWYILNCLFTYKVNEIATCCSPHHHKSEGGLHNKCVLSLIEFLRVYSTGEFTGLKLAIFDHFCDISVTYKGIPPLYIGLFSPQIWPDLRGVKIGVKKAEIRP